MILYHEKGDSSSLDRSYASFYNGLGGFYMDNKDILDIALRQSAIDLGCEPGDFLRSDNVIVASRADPRARKYLKLPFSCNLVSYGNNIVASVDEARRGLVSSYISRFPAEHCFETPNLHVLNDALQKGGQRICFMAEYFPAGSLGVEGHTLLGI